MVKPPFKQHSQKGNHPQKSGNLPAPCLPGDPPLQAWGRRAQLHVMKASWRFAPQPLWSQLCFNVCFPSPVDFITIPSGNLDDDPIQKLVMFHSYLKQMVNVFRQFRFTMFLPSIGKGSPTGSRYPGIPSLLLSGWRLGAGAHCSMFGRCQIWYASAHTSTPFHVSRCGC